MTKPPVSPTVVTLRALAGEPLLDDVVRRMVVATAAAIAERTGVPVREIDTLPDRVVVTLDTDRLAAVGFAAELRTLTTNWYQHKTGIDHLWGPTPPHEAPPPGLDDEWTPPAEL